MQLWYGTRGQALSHLAWPQRTNSVADISVPGSQALEQRHPAAQACPRPAWQMCQLFWACLDPTVVVKRVPSALGSCHSLGRGWTPPCMEPRAVWVSGTAPVPALYKAQGSHQGGWRGHTPTLDPHSQALT